MAIRTLDLTLEGTTSLRRETATGIRPPGGEQREKGGLEERIEKATEVRSVRGNEEIKRGKRESRRNRGRKRKIGQRKEEEDRTKEGRGR